MEKKTFINRTADAANMPKDVVLGVPILTMTGQNEVSVENYRGIIEYTDLLIRIQTKIGQIKIIGKSLQIDYYTNDEMKITGRITSIEYRLRGIRSVKYNHSIYTRVSAYTGNRIFPGAILKFVQP